MQKLNINDLTSLRSMAKNKTQLKLIERLYDETSLNGNNNNTIYLAGALEVNQAYNLVEKYPSYFKVIEYRCDYQSPTYYLVFNNL